MTFDRPALLLLLVLPLAALGSSLWRPGVRMVLPFDHGSMSCARWLARVLAGLHALPALMLALAVVVLAGPQTQERSSGKRILTNIEICLDCSGSMKDRFGERRRCDAATDALTRFTKRRTGDAFGLTIFSNEVVHWLPLTDHLDAIQRAAPFLDPAKLGEFSSGTQMKKALLACRDHLVQRHIGDRVLVLISDGEPTDFETDDSTALETASDLAAALVEEGIVTFVVHVAPDEVPDVMVELAKATGGFAFAADNEAKLQQVFARIDQMRPARYGQAQPRLVANFGPFAITGVVLGALYLCSLLGLRYTPW